MADNLNQILTEQLRDIHLPEAVSWWPLAFGWWLLFAVLLLGLASVVIMLRRHYMKNYYRKLALAELNASYSAWQQSNDSGAYLQSANNILKRVILHVDDTSTLANLSGQRWVDALNLMSKHKLSETTQQALAFDCYTFEPDSDIGHIQTNLKAWLLGHTHKLTDNNPLSDDEPGDQYA